MTNGELLTKSIAEKAIAENGLDTLGRFTQIDNGAAMLLSQSPDWLHLEGLRSLSVEAAASLSHHAYVLDLSGLHTLSRDVAAELARYKGNLLCLRGLSSLSDESASELSKYSGDVMLEKLLVLGDSEGHVRLAQKLSQYPSTLCLDDLQELSVRAASKLSQHYGDDGLHLDGLRNLSSQLAAELAQYQGLDLSLCGVKELSVDAARCLSRYDGALWLDGVAHLSNEAAEALAAHEKFLSLEGLKNVSDGVAAALAKHEGELGLSGPVAAVVGKFRR